MERLLPVLDSLFADHTEDDVALLDGLCGTLREMGVPLWRVAMQYPLLHPLYLGHSLYWWRDKGVTLIPRPHGFEQSTEFLESPYKAALDQGAPLRFRLKDEVDPGFDLLRDLKAKGGTDFINGIIPSHGAIAPGVSWSTDAEAGFSDGDIALLSALTPYLGPPFALRAERRTVGIMLETYLGAGPGAEVQAGAVQRGDSRQIEAVILQTDLRGFTSKSFSWNAADLLCALDTYFECVVDAVDGHGGDVLKFIGDGVLAVFPTDGQRSPERAARAAVETAQMAFRTLAEKNLTTASSWGGEVLTMAAAIDIGPVTHGNIGGKSRLDFTVIGNAVNRSSRVLDLAKRLNQPLAITAPVAALIESPSTSLGRHELAGIAEPVEVIALPLTH